MTSEALEEDVGHLFDSDPVVKRLTRGILRLQRKLHGQVDDQAWRTYLRLEAMANHRLDEILQRVSDSLVASPRARPVRTVGIARRRKRS